MNPQSLIDQYANAYTVNNDFIKNYGRFGDLWKNRWGQTARAAAQAEAVKYINPLRSRAQQGVRSDLARRGMFRSSLLNKNLGDTKQKYDRERDIRTESGTTTRKGELRSAYDLLMGTYEQDPTGAGKSIRKLIDSYKA